MPYTLYRTAPFPPSWAGNLAHGAVALASGGWVAAAEVVDPDGGHTACLGATITYPDNYAGPEVWCADTTAAVGARTYSVTEVNPGDCERLTKADANGFLKVDLEDVLGAAAQAVAGAPDVNVVSINGAAVQTVAGAPDVNVVSVNGGTFTGAAVPATVAAGAGADSAAGLALLLGLVVSTDHAQLTGHALANAPTGSGGTGGASLAQIQGELDTRGLTGTFTATATANLDAKVSTRSTYAGGAVASVTAPVTAGTVNDKTGYALGPAGLDAISAAPEPGRPTTYRGWLMTLARLLGNLNTMSSKVGASGNDRRNCYADDQRTLLTSQAVTDDGTTQTLGPLS